MKEESPIRFAEASPLESGSSAEPAKESDKPKKPPLTYIAIGIGIVITLLGAFVVGPNSSLILWIGAALVAIWLYLFVSETRRDPNGKLARDVATAPFFIGALSIIQGVFWVVQYGISSTEGTSGVIQVLIGLAFVAVGILTETVRSNSARKFLGSVREKPEASSDE